jgi:hypothetical protein
MEKSSPRLPEVGEYVRGQGVLVEVITTQPPIPAPMVEYVFEARSARKELRFNGMVLKEIETLWDWCGLGSGEKQAIEDLIGYCKEHGITKYSDVEAFVVREIDHVTKMPDNKPNYYASDFVNFEDVSRYSKVVKHEEIDVWSSKRGNIHEKHEVEE